MKIHPVSDVHNEFGVLKYNPPECDVVVCAGDIHPGVAGVIWAGETYGSLAGQPVIYVAGNHEFYGKRRLNRHYEKMQEKADSLGVHFLQNKTVVIGGVRFIGCTLWTDFDLFGDQPLAMIRAHNRMNDYRQILWDIGVPLTPHHILREFKTSFDFLQDELAKPFSGKTVVITHHAPCEQSCPPQYKGHGLNPCYASKLERFVEITKPNLWVHGHCHDATNYTVGNTNVVLNPRGYVGHEQTGFDDQLIIEI